MSDFDPYNFSRKEIQGVKIYYKNLPSAPCINVRVVFNVGSFNDPVGKEGLSHFFEHLVFNGSPILSDKKVIREWKKRHTLDTWNARTSFYNTIFWLKCLPEKYETVLAGVKDMIFFSYLREEDVEHEKKVIIQESWNRYKNAKYLAYIKEMTENLFHGHEHERFAGALGWPETIATISRNDIASFYKKYYGIGMFFVVLTGAVEEKHISAFGQFLKDLPKIVAPIRDIGTINRPKVKKVIKRGDEIGEIKEQAEISIIHSDEKIPYEKSEVSNLFVRLLSDILNERLRIEHSLCYSVSVRTVYGNSYSQSCVNVKTEEKNVTLVENEFRDILIEIKERRHADRFVIVKQTYLEQVRSSEFLSDDIADEALQEISRYDGHIITLEEQLELIEKVTYDDMTQCLARVFDPEYTYTEIILPSKK